MVPEANSQGEVSVEHDSEDQRHLPPPAQGLYDPANEHDACGLGFIAHIKGQKSHAIVTQGLVDSEEPHPSRRDRRRSAAGRRRRHPDPDARRVPAQGLRAARDDAAGDRTLRRGHGLPAEGAGVAHGVRAGDRARRGERGPDPPRLARRSDRQRRAVAAHEGGRAGDPPGVHRQRHQRHGPGCAGAQALHHPQEVGPRDPGAAPEARQGVLRAVDVDAHARLQGDAARASGRRILPRPEGREHGVGAGDGAPALLDQHVPDVGPRPPVPARLPQRRDQHAARQRQLDPRAAARHREQRAGRRPRQDLAADLRRPVRFGVVRQRARAPA